MKDLIVDTHSFVVNATKLQNSLEGYQIEIKRISSGDRNAAKEIMSLISSGNYRKLVLLVDVNSEIKKEFPNNSVEINGVEDYNCRFQKIVNSIKWILSQNGKEKPMDSKTFFVSDTHFFHANIIKYCNRPWKSGTKDEDGEFLITEKDVYDMNEAIISNWNSVVGPDDVVWHLGDFALGNRNRIPEIVSRLNGKKHLVLGNHDYFNVDKKNFKDVVDFFYKAGFEKVYDRPVVLNDFVILSHEPMSFVKAPFFSVYGHIHDNELYSTYSKHGCCVCVERHDYTPISWKKICEECRKLGAGEDE